MVLLPRKRLRGKVSPSEAMAKGHRRVDPEEVVNPMRDLCMRAGVPPLSCVQRGDGGHVILLRPATSAPDFCGRKRAFCGTDTPLVRRRLRGKLSPAEPQQGCE